MGLSLSAWCLPSSVKLTAYLNAEVTEVCAEVAEWLAHSSLRPLRFFFAFSAVTTHRNSLAQILINLYCSRLALELTLQFSTLL